jgi:transmembrane sensor
MLGRSAGLKLDRALEDACAWVVRLQDGDVDDALAFDAWLEASELNRAAYDRAMAVWAEYGQAAPAVLSEWARRERDRSRTLRRTTTFAFGALAASAATAAVLLTLQPSSQPGAAQAYATGVGQMSTVRLEDGSVVELNARTKLTVAYEAHARRVTLEDGEAAFDVAHDAGRPFLITAGDRTVRVVGTRFDVRRRQGQLSVTVDRGVVEVRPTTQGAGQAYRLHAGQKLTHREGAVATDLSLANAAEALSWREGKLVFQDRPLREVVAELNLHLARPMRLEDPALGARRVSGVVMLDDEAAVLRRMALLAPVTPIVSPDGVVLRGAAEH